MLLFSPHTPKSKHSTPIISPIKSPNKLLKNMISHSNSPYQNPQPNQIMADSPSKSKTNSLIHHTTTKKGGWNAAIFIICKFSPSPISYLSQFSCNWLYSFCTVVEFAERFAYQGLASNLINYLTKFLNEPTTTAVKNVNTWVGVSSLFPLLGGFVADSYLGRFNTILLSSLIYLVVNNFSTSPITTFYLHLCKSDVFAQE